MSSPITNPFQYLFSTTQPQPTQQQPSTMLAMLSPRNLIKFISTSIDQYSYKQKKYIPNVQLQKQFIQESFRTYLDRIQNVMVQYKNLKKKLFMKDKQKQENNKNQLIQMKLKIDKIPQEYFVNCKQFVFIFDNHHSNNKNKNTPIQKLSLFSLKRKQQQISEYLDQIQLLLWNKTSKNPEKYFQSIDIHTQTINIVNNNLYKIKQARDNHMKRLKYIDEKNKKIIRLVKKCKQIEQLLQKIHLIKKLKALKPSSQKITHPNQLQTLQSLKKHQLSQCCQLLCLSKIIQNLQQYRQQLKSNIYNKFNIQIVQLMKIILKYDKHQWSQQKVKGEMLFNTEMNSNDNIKEGYSDKRINNNMKRISFNNHNNNNNNKNNNNKNNNNNNNNQNNNYNNNNILDQSHLNLTILDQSYFTFTQPIPPHPTNTNIIPQQQPQLPSQQQFSLSIITTNLLSIWQFILKYDLYDQEQINQLIMRQLIKHNVLFNKDLNQYLEKLFQEYQQQKNIHKYYKNDINDEEDNAILQEISSDDEDKLQSAINANCQSESTQDNHGQQINQCYMSNVTKYTQKNSQININIIKNKTFNTFNTFKKFGNVKKLTNVIKGSKIATNLLNTNKQTKIHKQQNYCKLKQQQSLKLQRQNLLRSLQPVSASTSSSPTSITPTQQKLSLISTHLFIKSCKFYYELLTSFLTFILSHSSLEFLTKFLQKYFSFIESRIKYFFTLRKINQSTEIEQFMQYLQLIQYWYDICDDVYQNLLKIKKQIIQNYLTCLHKNVLVKQLKQQIQSEKYMAGYISSEYVQMFYYVINWKNIVDKKELDQNDMSMTMLNVNNQFDSNRNIYNKGQNNHKSNFIIDNNMILNQQNQHEQQSNNQFKIIDKKLIYQNNQYYLCNSFLTLLKQLQKYLKLREILPQHNQNIEQKICQVIGFYVWYNLKNITNPKSNQKKTLKNFCIISSTIQFLKLLFTCQLNLKQTKKSIKTLGQFNQFTAQIQKSITMIPFLLFQHQISLIYESNSTSPSHSSTITPHPCKQTLQIISILHISIQQLKHYFLKSKIIKFLQPSIKLINKNYYGYLISLGKKGLLQLKQFIPKFKEIFLNVGFKEDKYHKYQQNQVEIQKNQQQSKKSQECMYLFIKQINQMEKCFKSKSMQFK